jgi:hypothetical protein
VTESAIAVVVVSGALGTLALVLIVLIIFDQRRF